MGRIVKFTSRCLKSDSEEAKAQAGTKEGGIAPNGAIVMPLAMVPPTRRTIGDSSHLTMKAEVMLRALSAHGDETGPCPTRRLMDEERLSVPSALPRRSVRAAQRVAPAKRRGIVAPKALRVGVPLGAL